MIVIFKQVLYFGPQLDSIIVIVDELHKDMFEVRSEELEIGNNWEECIHFYLKMLPNELLLARILDQLFLTKNSDIGYFLNEFVLTLELFLYF